MQAMQWLLMEIGVLVALVPSVIAFFQWRRRRATVQALEALSKEIKDTETERKHTLTGILTGAHHMSEARGAEVADSLIRSERTFFRHCFSTMLSQDKTAIEQLKQNLYGVLDDYLRKCASDAQRASVAVHAPSPEELDIISPAAGGIETPAAPPPMADSEIDWDAAFAETVLASPEDSLSPTSGESASGMEALAVDGFEDLLDSLENETEAEPPANETTDEEQLTEEAPPPPADSDDDVMAAWGEALEQQNTPPEAEEKKDDGFDLSWEDAFLEETVSLKPDEQKPES